MLIAGILIIVCQMKRNQGLCKNELYIYLTNKKSCDYTIM